MIKFYFKMALIKLGLVKQVQYTIKAETGKVGAELFL